jgi:alpha-glucosidase
METSLKKSNRLPLLRWLACSLTCSLALLGSEPLSVVSPNGKLKLSLAKDADGQWTYSFGCDGRKLIKPSRTGAAGDVANGPTRASVDTVWHPLWGKRAVVPERYNELTLDLKTGTLVARAYDDGVAIRSLGRAETATDAMQFDFAGDYTAWFYNGEKPNIGPVKLSENTTGNRPVMTVKVDESCYLAVHEADLRTGDPMVFRPEAGTTRLSIASHASEAWRVILCGKNPGALIDSHLIELLNPPPPKDADFSWVKPGVAVWDWRINGAKAGDFQYRMSYPSWVRMVDFAAENAIPYLVLDADWYGKEFAKQSDPTQGGYAGDARKLIQYAKGKNVGVWLYLNDVAGRAYPIEKTLATYGEWGAVGVKYGFMKGSAADKNRWTRRITELCAQNKLLCDFHDGPVHPYGQMRTWPNAVTREFCQSQLDGHKVMTPGTFMTAVFVNMVAGPLDMNNGLADLMQAGRSDNHSPVPSTLAGEAARTLIVFSGAIVIPDIPENYRKHPELLQFIASEKMPWRESRTLSGTIGEHIVVARQASDGTWLVGAATNEAPRELDLPLDFLPTGQYEALIIQDGADADYRTHVESYQVEKRTVTSADTIHLKLAPGGGACLRINGITPGKI